MITALRVQNLRGIVDSGVIGIRKINVIVGRNSAGKSSLLRVLPLLRQSVERSTKGPILWYGRLVDFGSFANAVRRSSGGSIMFEFRIDLKLDRIVSRSAAALFGPKVRRRSSRVAVDAHITLGDDRGDEVGRLKNISLMFESDNVELHFNENALRSVSINGRHLKLDANHSWYTPQGNIFPGLWVLREDRIVGSDGEEEKSYSFEEEPFEKDFLDAMEKVQTLWFASDRFKSSIVNTPYAAAGDYFESLCAIPDLTPEFSQVLNAEGPGGLIVGELRSAALANSLHTILGAIDTEITNFASGVRYIEPLRATAERYYRLQDLAVDEIDSRGGNVAMFLNSLNYFEKRDLESWMSKNLGFVVQVAPGAGHVEVKVKGESGDLINIADLGFGYSQMLPIVLQLWRSLVSPKRGPGEGQRPIIAMEQPELHLHPQYQALFADVIVASLSSPQSGDGVVFAETHSEHLVNRLGELVAQKKVNPSDVQVIVVSSDDEGCSFVRCVEFSSAGFLGENWPVGFFVPRANHAVLG